MKKEIFDVISRWHQEHKRLLALKKVFEAKAFYLQSMAEPANSKEDVAFGLSKILDEDISPQAIKWGAPSTHFPCKSELEVGCGYIYPIQNLGWILVWQGKKEVMFLDKNLFDIELCKPDKIISRTEMMVRRIIIAIIIITVFIIMIALK